MMKSKTSFKFCYPIGEISMSPAHAEAGSRHLHQYKTVQNIARGSRNAKVNDDSTPAVTEQINGFSF